MECHVDVMMSSEGANVLQVVEAMKGVGLKPVAGVHDFSFEYGDDKEYFDVLTRMHETLRGMKVRYRVQTNVSGTKKENVIAWPWDTKF